MPYPVYIMPKISNCLAPKGSSLLVNKYNVVMLYKNIPGWLTVLKSGYTWLTVPQSSTPFPWRWKKHYHSPWIYSRSCIPILVLTETPGKYITMF